MPFVTGGAEPADFVRLAVIAVMAVDQGLIARRHAAFLARRSALDSAAIDGSPENGADSLLESRHYAARRLEGASNTSGRSTWRGTRVAFSTCNTRFRGTSPSHLQIAAGVRPRSFANSLAVPPAACFAARSPVTDLGVWAARAMIMRRKLIDD